MKFEVRGFDIESNERRSVTVDADDEVEALKAASAEGLTGIHACDRIGASRTEAEEVDAASDTRGLRTSERFSRWLLGVNERSIKWFFICILVVGLFFAYRFIRSFGEPWRWEQIALSQRAKAQFLGQEFPLLERRPAIRPRVLMVSEFGLARCNDQLPEDRQIGDNLSDPLTLVYFTENVYARRAIGHYVDEFGRQRATGMELTYHVWIINVPEMEAVGYCSVAIGGQPEIGPGGGDTAGGIGPKLPEAIGRWVNGGGGRVLAGEDASGPVRIDLLNQIQCAFEVRNHMINNDVIPYAGVPQERHRKYAFPTDRSLWTPAEARAYCQEHGLPEPEFLITSE